MTELLMSKGETRGRTAHRLAGDLPGGHEFLCGGRAWPAVPAPAHLPRCRMCDGAAFGPVVYRYYDADGGLLYIGSTQNIVNRVNGHAVYGWWPDVARMTVDRFPTLTAAREAEAAAIACELPRHNVRGKPKTS